MALNPNYCRTCGYSVESKDVCYNCGCPPLKGHEYCFNCSAPTLPEAIICVHCNTELTKKVSPVAAVLIIAGIIVASAITGIFISQLSKAPAKTVAKNDTTFHSTPAKKNTAPLVAQNKISDLPPQIINKPIVPATDSTAIRNTNIIRQQQDTLSKLIRSLQITQKAFLTPPKIYAPLVVHPVSKKVSVNIFSAKELDDYDVGCSFFSNQKNKNSIVFFYTKTLGYAKINGSITEVKLKGYDKLNGLYKFSNSKYDITVYIEGLAGSDEQWYAAGTLSITDSEQGVFTVNKVYSTCAMD